MADIISNYVKFRRGTPSAFEALSEKDSDTLYFIYEEDELSGELYLGSKLISGNSEINGATSISGLTDILLSEDLDTNHCLVYDISQKKWINKPIMSVIKTFVGANSTSKGVPGLVPATKAAGDTGLFLRSDGEWAEVVSASAVTIKQTIVTAGESHLEAINRIYPSMPKTGDIVILKELICEKDIYQNIAYIYNTNEWIALDGNYDIEKIYLSSDLTITADIGVQKLNGAGSKKLNTSGKNLKQVLDMILASRNLPTYEEPSVSISCPQAKSYEVGTTVTLNYIASFEDGKYQFAPGENTGVTVNSWKATFGDEEIFNSEGTFQPVIVTDDFSDRISIVVDYGKGVAPEDNLGNVVTDDKELEKCQIQSGTKKNYSGYVKGFRNMFYGSKSEKIDLSNKNIRKLSKKAVTKGSFDMPVIDGATQVIIALPVGYTLGVVADKVAFGTDISSRFELNNISIAGATEGYDKDYNVYVYTPSTALGENTYTVTVI